MLMWQDGVYRIDFNYVAALGLPFWQIWDMALLWLAMIHGANGLRTIIGDYARKNVTKFYLNSLLLLATGSRWFWAPTSWSPSTRILGANQ